MKKVEATDARWTRPEAPGRPPVHCKQTRINNTFELHKTSKPNDMQDGRRRIRWSLATSLLGVALLLIALSGHSTAEARRRQGGNEGANQIQHPTIIGTVDGRKGGKVTQLYTLVPIQLQMVGQPGRPNKRMNNNKQQQHNKKPTVKKQAKHRRPTRGQQNKKIEFLTNRLSENEQRVKDLQDLVTKLKGQQATPVSSPQSTDVAAAGSTASETQRLGPMDGELAQVEHNPTQDKSVPVDETAQTEDKSDSSDNNTSPADDKSDPIADKPARIENNPIPVESTPVSEESTTASSASELTPTEAKPAPIEPIPVETKPTFEEAETAPTEDKSVSTLEPALTEDKSAPVKNEEPARVKDETPVEAKPTPIEDQLEDKQASTEDESGQKEEKSAPIKTEPVLEENRSTSVEPTQVENETPVEAKLNPMNFQTEDEPVPSIEDRLEDGPTSKKDVSVQTEDFSPVDNEMDLMENVLADEEIELDSMGDNQVDDKPASTNDKPSLTEVKDILAHLEDIPAPVEAKSAPFEEDKPASIEDEPVRADQKSAIVKNELASMENEPAHVETSLHPIEDLIIGVKPALNGAASEQTEDKSVTVKNEPALVEAKPNPIEGQLEDKPGAMKDKTEDELASTVDKSVQTEENLETTKNAPVEPASTENKSVEAKPILVEDTPASVENEPVPEEIEPALMLDSSVPVEGKSDQTSPVHTEDKPEPTSPVKDDASPMLSDKEIERQRKKAMLDEMTSERKTGELDESDSSLKKPMAKLPSIPESMRKYQDKLDIVHDKLGHVAHNLPPVFKRGFVDTEDERNDSDDEGDDDDDDDDDDGKDHNHDHMAPNDDAHIDVPEDNLVVTEMPDEPGKLNLDSLLNNPESVEDQIKGAARDTADLSGFPLGDHEIKPLPIVGSHDQDSLIETAPEHEHAPDEDEHHHVLPEEGLDHSHHDEHVDMNTHVDHHDHDHDHDHDEDDDRHSIHSDDGNESDHEDYHEDHHEDHHDDHHDDDHDDDHDDEHDDEHDEEHHDMDVQPVEDVIHPEPHLDHIPVPTDVLPQVHGDLIPPEGNSVLPVDSEPIYPDHVTPPPFVPHVGPEPLHPEPVVDDHNVPIVVSPPVIPSPHPEAFPSTYTNHMPLPEIRTVVPGPYMHPIPSKPAVAFAPAFASASASAFASSSASAFGGASATAFAGPTFGRQRPAGVSAYAKSEPGRPPVAMTSHSSSNHVASHYSTSSSGPAFAFASMNNLGGQDYLNSDDSEDPLPFRFTQVPFEDDRRGRRRRKRPSTRRLDSYNRRAKNAAKRMRHQVKPHLSQTVDKGQQALNAARDKMHNAKDHLLHSQPPAGYTLPFQRAVADRIGEYPSLPLNIPTSLHRLRHFAGQHHIPPIPPMPPMPPMAANLNFGAPAASVSIRNEHNGLGSNGEHINSLHEENYVNSGLQVEPAVKGGLRQIQTAAGNLNQVNQSTSPSGHSKIFSRSSSMFSRLSSRGRR